MKQRNPLLDFWLALLALWLLFGGQMQGCSLDWLPVVGPVAGPRHVLIVREAGDVNLAMDAMFVALRKDKYFAEKGHKLTILDDEAKDPDGSASDFLDKFKPLAPPELLIIAPPDKLLSRQKLPADAAGVLTVLKANGG